MTLKDGSLGAYFFRLISSLSSSSSCSATL